MNPKEIKIRSLQTRLVEIVVSDSGIVTSEIRECAGMKTWGLKTGMNC